MILNGSDGINCSLTMGPRALKIVYHALDKLKPEDYKDIAVSMYNAGFEYTAGDVHAVTRQIQLSLADVAMGIHKHQEPGQEQQDKPPKALIQ